MSAIYGKEGNYNLLNAKGITFEKLEHEAVYTMEDLDKAGITAKESVCKDCFCGTRKKKHFLVITAEEKWVDSKILAEELATQNSALYHPSGSQNISVWGRATYHPFAYATMKSVTVVFGQELQFNRAVGVHPNAGKVWLRKP